MNEIKGFVNQKLLMGFMGCAVSKARFLVAYAPQMTRGAKISPSGRNDIRGRVGSAHPKRF